MTSLGRFLRGHGRKPDVTGKGEIEQETDQLRMCDSKLTTVGWVLSKGLDRTVRDVRGTREGRRMKTEHNRYTHTHIKWDTDKRTLGV